MKEKALVLAVCLACASPAASLNLTLSNSISALNLGEIESSSRVGEPFEGIIPFLSATNAQAHTLKVSLAPSSIYKKLGRKKSPELHSLKFIVTNTLKKPTIRIKSNKVINTSSLELILKIESSQDVIYQYYNVVLTPKIKNKVIVKNATNSVESKFKTSSYTIKRGDSLSKIAQKFKTPQVSLNRMMEAIHLRNPDSFINNDINRIESGKTLYIPTLEETKNIEITHELPAKKVETKNSQTYTVKEGDSLYKITRGLNITDISLTKMMTAIYKQNPHAFSKNKMNILRVNSVLTIPTFKKNDPIQLTQTKKNKEAFSKNESPIKKLVSDMAIARKDAKKINSLKAEIESISKTINAIKEHNKTEIIIAKPEENTLDNNKKSFTSSSKEILDTINYLSARNLSYASLILILSLLLLHRRKQKKLKTASLSPNKESISTEDIIASLRSYKESQSTTNISISEINLNRSTFKKHQYLSAKEIHECEVLVNELVDKLEEEKAEKDDAPIYSTHNQQIDAILNNTETGFDEFIQENIALIAKINGMGMDDPKTIKSHAQRNNELTHQTKNNTKSDISLFEEKMDLLAKLTNTDEIKDKPTV